MNGTTTKIDTDAAAGLGRWVTLHEAAGTLGISRDSVRRRVAAQVLRAERRRTVRGPRLFVWLPAEGVSDLADLGVDRQDPDDSAGDAPRGGTDAAQSGAVAAHSGADSARVGAGAARGGAALAQDRARDMAEYTAVLLAPLHAQLAEQSEELGRVRAELAHARAQLAERDRGLAETQHDAASKWPERRRWWQRALWG